MKLVVNKCYGGFSISKKCAELMASLGCPQAAEELKENPSEDKWYGYGYTDNYKDGYKRDSEYLIKAVEQLGSKDASGFCAQLKIVVIPDDVEWELDEYDGIESVHEKHRSW